MKKATFPMLGILAVITLNALFAFTPAQANIADNTCRVEVFDCPGIGTGDRQICHDGAPVQALECTCGASTPCP